MDFKEFAKNVNEKFNKMAKGSLYVVELEHKNELWDLYLDSFPEGTNEIYKTNREHDCNCCKQFIRNIGNVVSIVNNNIVTVWDCVAEDEYEVVASALSLMLKNKIIKSEFMTDMKKFGAEKTVQLLEGTNDVINWNHFHCEVPDQFVDKYNYRSKLAESNSTKQVFERGVEEITLEAIDIVLDLIDQNSIYRGEEFKNGVKAFRELKKNYIKLKTNFTKNIFIWGALKAQAVRIRNTAIGTLLVDLSNGMDLTEAVKLFETKVAPTNYKRTTSLVTQGMIDEALKTIRSLDIENSLHRRYATASDVSINNVLFADRSVTNVMRDSLETLLKSGVKKDPKIYKNVDEIDVEDFIKNILPNVDTMEVFVAGQQTRNLFSLVAPQEHNSPNILKWDNNFTWSYNGEIADSMKERVKSFGGNVDGVLRFSIQWNDPIGSNQNDLDAHCGYPGGLIFYVSKNHPSVGGFLDVDIIHPSNKVAVENIIFTDLRKMPDGDYFFKIHNFSERGGIGWAAELEFEGQLYEFSSNKKMRQSEKVDVGTVKKTGNRLELVSSMDHQKSSKDIWGIKTEQFCKVSMMMLSPNHWDGNKTGNKHYFFVLDGCNNPNSTRGLYNEFLHDKFTKHRKVFELLGSKLKCAESDNQLSGLGFSSTQRNELLVKVAGNFTRMLKIKF